MMKRVCLKRTKVLNVFSAKRMNQMDIALSGTRSKRSVALWFNPARIHECQLGENETELNLMRYPESFMRSFSTRRSDPSVSHPRQFPSSASTATRWKYIIQENI